MVIAWCYYVVSAIFPLMYDPANAVRIESNDSGDRKCYVHFPFSYAYYQLALNFITPLLLVLLINAYMFRFASTAIAFHKISNEDGKNLRSKRFASNYRATKTIAVVVVNVSLCWLTYIVIITRNFACPICYSAVVTYIGKMINCTSIVTNPILYGLLNKSIRKFIFGMYRGCIRGFFRKSSVPLCAIEHHSSHRRAKLTSTTESGLLDDTECDKQTTHV